MKNIVRLAWITLVIGLAGSLSTLWAGWNDPASAASVKKEEKADASGIVNIAITANNTDLIVTESDTGQIVVRLEGSYKGLKPEEMKLTVKASGDTLQIGEEHVNRLAVGVLLNQRKLTVELPKKRFAFIQASTGNGNQVWQFAQAYRAVMETSSGNIRTSGLETGETKFRTGSGNAELESGTGAVVGDSSSGNVTIKADSFDRNASIRTTSGNVRFKLARDPQSLYIHFHSQSGDGSIPGQPFVLKSAAIIDHAFGNGENRLDVTTRSGDFTFGK